MTHDPLIDLCRDRPLITPELHASNDFYGHATLLKRHAGLPRHRALHVAIEHAITFNEYLWDVDVQTRMAAFLCGSPAIARAFEARSGGRVRAVPIGPLALYAPRPAAPVTERCLVVFPTHSTHRVRTEFDIDAFLAMIEDIRPSFDRVVVCVYWKDVLHGMHLRFRERGLECVSAGHMYDPGFLARLVHILSRASLVFTNEIGTQILLATLLGKPVWLRRMDIRYIASKEVLAVDVPEFLEHPNLARVLSLFAEPRDDVSPEQRTFVEDLTGAAHHRAPAELRDLLAEADHAYRQRRGLETRVRDLISRGLYHGRRVERAARQRLDRYR